MESIKIDGRIAELYSRDYKTGETEFSIYPIYKHELQDKNGMIKCRGRIKPFSAKTPITVEGFKEGGIFVVSDCYVSVDTKDNIERYLRFVSRDFSDIQIEKLADFIIGSGEDLFDLINLPSTKDVILDILKRTNKKEYLTDLLIKKTNEIHECNIFFDTLLKHDVPYDKIWSMSINGITLETLNKNPYKIFSDFEIPIDIADNYAMKELSYSSNSVQRYEGFTRSAVKSILSSGDTCIKINDLLKKVNVLIKAVSQKNNARDSFWMTPITLNYSLSHLKDWCSIKEIDGTNYIYINHVYNEESTALLHVKRLSVSSRKTGLKVDIDKVQDNLGISYNKEQINAFNLLKTTGIKILTGPPGSGKTALIRGFIDVFRQNGINSVRLSATTGMAADVLTKASGIINAEEAATTVHVMLKITPFEEEGMLSAAVKELDAKLIIVDEISMLGLNLFATLASAIKNNAILLLVGDENQLQSVDYGNVLSDLIKSRAIETYKLKTIFRSNDVIAANAQNVLAGATDEIIENNLFHIERYPDEEKILERVFTLADNDSIILSPIKKGAVGTDSLNKILQSKNKDIDRNKSILYGEQTFYVGDKIVMTRNNYVRGYINGDIGKIEKIFDDGILIRFKSSLTMIGRSDICDMSLAYAETVHKSQGSEYNKVIMILPEDDKGMLTRRLLYTAITRAKNEIYLLCVNNAFKNAINNKKERKRTTLLAQRLKTQLS